MLRHREAHRQPIYAVAFNQVDASLVDTFAACGANRVTIYGLTQGKGQEDGTSGVLSTTDQGPQARSNKRVNRADGKGADGELHGYSLQVLQAYCDEDKDERFYCCDWGVDGGMSVDGGQLSGGLLAVAGAMRHIKVLDCCTGNVRAVLSGHGGDVFEVRFHPCERSLLLSASNDESVRLWHVRLAECLATFSGHRDAVVTLDVRLDGKCFATGSFDGSIKLWSLDDERMRQRIETATAAAAALLPLSEASSGAVDERVEEGDAAKCAMRADQDDAVGDAKSAESAALDPEDEGACSHHERRRVRHGLW